MNVNIKNLNLSVIMPAITKSGQPVCNDREPSKDDKVEHASGLYLIYEDGHVEPFTGDNSKDCVRYIGLKHGYMSFAISLTEHDNVQLLDDDSREESGSGTYYERECDALFDFDGQKNTDELNKAFAYVSASPLSSAWYWSSTEYSQSNAWYVSFSNGGTSSNGKYSSIRVRAVAAFTFKL